ncbi:carbonic anhydrase 9 [Mixophyes fleayi]|uniref:carbonic anhydrase 9 n=1 Tax=Mixophyes fleayi TaxID=3061075 RepID=UPI003F4E2FAB
MAPSNLYVLLLITCILGTPVRCEDTEDNGAHPTDLEDHLSDHEDHSSDHEAHPTDYESHPSDLEDHLSDHEDHSSDHEAHPSDHEDHSSDHEDHSSDHEAHPPGHGTGHWGYTDETEWNKIFPDCAGRAQSPINVDTKKTTYDPSLTTIQLSGYDVESGETLKLKNNGHTVVLQLPDSLKIVQGLSHIYQAAQLHFHWGSRSSPGSEHTVNGQKFPGEIHVVHFSTEYQSLDAAMTQPGGLAVLAAFIQEGPVDDESYGHLLSYLDDVREAGKSTEIPGFDIRGLLPQRLDRYYRYNGSLTTPPCFQTVNWTIFNQTISLSAKQLAVLEDTIHHDHGSVLQMNFREPQSLNGRRVLSSFRAPVSGRKATDGAPEPSVVTSQSDDSSSNQSGPDTQGAEKSGLGTGDMLAILFGILFIITALAFFLYVRSNGKKNQRSPEKKSNVIYKAASTEENMV